MMGSDTGALIEQAMWRVCECGHVGALHEWGASCKQPGKEGEEYCGCDRYSFPNNLPALLKQLEAEDIGEVHEVGLDCTDFDRVESGQKTFLFVKDKGAAPCFEGAIIKLRERNIGWDGYTDREYLVRVVYVEYLGIKYGVEGYTILGIAPLKKKENQ